MKRSHRLVIIAASVTLMVVSAAGPATADWSAGLELYGQSRFAEAAEHFRATVTSNPHWPGGYLMLGRCQLALEQYDEALENLQKAAELGPDDPANVATLSRALMAVDRYADARVVLEGLDLEKLSPDWKAEVARMLARCLLVEDRTADAVAVLQERLIDDPDRAALHRAIAGAYQAAGDRAAEHPFAVARAINIGRIKEVDSSIQRGVNSTDRLLVIYFPPSMGSLPGPEWTADCPTPHPQCTHFDSRTT